MKKALKITGGIFCIILIIAAMWLAMEVGFGFFLLHHRQAQVRAMQQQQMNQGNGNPMGPSISVIEGTSLSPAKQDAAELAGKLPSLFDDPEGYEFEDNWLATSISREIAKMAFVAAHADQPLPDIKTKAMVDPDKPQVHVEITGFDAKASAPITSDLTPSFAWDAQGYAPLASQLLGNRARTPPVAETDETDTLSHLLNLSGTGLVLEDIRLTKDLQEHPTSWQNHEAAALLLTALALREIGETKSDNRAALNRATAHLAIAQALRSNQPATMPGLIADAAIRTISGREVDAMKTLGDLSKRTDLPDSVKTWIAALKLLASQDWRVAEVTPSSPLLLKISWFKVVNRDTTPTVAADWIRAKVPSSLDSKAPNTPPKINPETLIPDWARIGGFSPFFEQADDPIENGRYKLNLELHELSDILQAQGLAPLDITKLATVLTKDEPDSVFQDASGKTVTQVIGPGLFKAVTRRHLYAAPIGVNVDDDPPPQLDPSQPRIRTDPNQVRNFYDKLDVLFKGMPDYEIEKRHFGNADGMTNKRQHEDWLAEKRKWHLWQVSYFNASDMPGRAFIKRFYSRGVPFGTVYNIDERLDILPGSDSPDYPEYETPELEAIKKLPPQEEMEGIAAYNAKYNESVKPYYQKKPTLLEKKLSLLAPGEYRLATDHIPQDEVLPAAMPFLDYNLRLINLAEGSETINPAEYKMLLKKDIVFEPEYGFVLGKELYHEGKQDEAAVVFRKAVADTDAQTAANNELDLLDYDLNHGQKDEALSLAKKAADSGSIFGIGSYCETLDRLGRLDEAETVAKQINEQYSQSYFLNAFYVRHRDKYAYAYGNILKQAYPDGLSDVKLSDFTGPPKEGCIITSSSHELKLVKLQKNDVVVGLDGHRVGSEQQYDVVRALKADPEMDFIVWRKGQYLEIKGWAINRRMFVDLGDYSSP